MPASMRNVRFLGDSGHRVLTGETAFLAAEIPTEIDNRLVVCASPDRVGIRFRHAVRCIHFSCKRKQRRFCPTVGRQLDQLVDLKTEGDSHSEIIRAMALRPCPTKIRYVQRPVLSATPSGRETARRARQLFAQGSL